MISAAEGGVARRKSSPHFLFPPESELEGAGELLSDGGDGAGSGLEAGAGSGEDAGTLEEDSLDEDEEEEETAGSGALDELLDVSSRDEA
jgi:hypothetical protein